MLDQSTQAMIAGLVVKLVVDRLKPLLTKVDEEKLADKFSRQIHALVFVASALATIGNLALDHQLSQLDVTSAVTSMTMLALTHFSAVSLNEIGKLFQRKK